MEANHFFNIHIIMVNVSFGMIIGYYGLFIFSPNTKDFIIFL